MIKYPSIFSLAINSYWRNSSVIILAIIIGKAISFFWKIFIARLGAQYLGQTEAIMSVLSVATTFSILGFQTSIIRFIGISKNTNLKYQFLNFTFKLTLTLSLIIVLILMFTPRLSEFLFLNATSYINLNNYIWVLPAIIITEITLSYLIALNKSALYAFYKYILPPMSRIILLTILALNFSTISNVITQHLVFAPIITLFVIAGVEWSKLKPVIKQILPAKKIQEYFKYTFPMSGSLVLFSFYTAFDVLILAKYAGLAVVGEFTAIIVLAGVLDVIVSPFLNILPTYLGQLYKNPQSAIRFVWINIGVYVGISLLASLIILAGQDLFIKIFFGQNYFTYNKFLLILLVFKILQDSIILPLRHLLDYYGYVKYTFVCMGLTTLVKLSIASVLVKHLLVTGVVISHGASIITHLIVVVGGFLYLQKALINHKFIPAGQ